MKRGWLPGGVGVAKSNESAPNPGILRELGAGWLEILPTDQVAHAGLGWLEDGQDLQRVCRTVQV